MTINLGVIMDPINTINISKDSTFAILLAAQRRNYIIYYMECKDLYLYKGKACAMARIIHLQKNNQKWFDFISKKNISLSRLDVILMRKNPPFNMDFIYSTYILEFAERIGTLVINKPQSLRDCNEKLFACWFPDLTAPTLVTKNTYQIKKFQKKYQDIILKPLGEMGGSSIFRIQPNDPNFSVIIETMTKNETTFCMLQNYLPQIKDGDKRILIVNGKPIPYCLARIPKKGETRGNLAVGGTGRPQILSPTDKKISYQIGPILKKKGLLLVGLDIIGDKITEINVTSPTCICELENFYSISITNIFLDAIEKILTKNKNNCKS